MKLSDKKNEQNSLSQKINLKFRTNKGYNKQLQFMDISGKPKS